jgi:hypothetical protein
MEYGHVHAGQTTLLLLNNRAEIIPKQTVILTVFERTGILRQDN